ncbi:hypothetical protein FRB90_005498, partial [Tulasnella sp. 427]
MKPEISQVDSDELARFREEWKNEVRQKHHQPTQPATSTNEAEASTTTESLKDQTKEVEPTKGRVKRPSADLSKALGKLPQRADPLGGAGIDAEGRRPLPRNVADLSLTHKQTEA